MAVGILEVAGVAAPERRLARLDQRRAGALGAGRDGIDLVGAGDVVAERELGGATLALGEAAVVRDVGARPERELEAGLQIEEDDGAMLELPADDALRGQAEAVAVEGKRPLQIVDAKGDEGGVSWTGFARKKGEPKECHRLFTVPTPRRARGCIEANPPAFLRASARAQASAQARWTARRGR